MTDRLLILKPEVIENRFGEKETVFTYLKTIYAERVKATGQRKDEVGEHFPDYSVQWNVRIAQPVAENWRVEEQDGYLYNVFAIVPNKRCAMKTLVCERVNP